MGMSMRSHAFTNQAVSFESPNIHTMTILFIIYGMSDVKDEVVLNGHKSRLSYRMTRCETLRTISHCFNSLIGIESAKVPEICLGMAC